MDSAGVVITGLGAISPLGLTVSDMWAGLSAGKCGISKITAFDATGFGCQLAGQAPDYKIQQFVPKTYRKAVKLMCRDIELAVIATNEALTDSGLITKGIDPENINVQPERMAINVGAGLISCDLVELANAVAVSITDGKFDIQKWGKHGIELVPPLWLLKYLPNMLACHISIIHDAQGPNNTITAGDTSGIQAIGEASRIIQRGDADIMLAGAAESKVHPLTIVRQHLLGNLSERSDEPKKASRPFEKNRDGLVLAEGAGVVVLEEISHAEERGAKIYGEVVGFGSSSSACAPNKADADGQGLARSIKAACADSGLNDGKIDYILAHGLSCPLSDVAETRAIKEALGERAKQIPISAIKSMTGHCGAASGAIEVIAAALALKNSRIPPTINYEENDPECDLDYVPNEAREFAPRAVLVNSFGFGGQNSSLVLRKLK